MLPESEEQRASLQSTDGVDDEPWSIVSDDLDRLQEASVSSNLPGAVFDDQDRAELLQDTPFSHSAINGGALQEFGNQEHLLSSAEDERADGQSEVSEVLSSWRSTDQLGRDIKRAVSARPKISVKKADTYLKILVVGDIGSGRTTAMKTLFTANDADQPVAFQEVARADSLRKFESDPSAMCTEIALDGADAGCRIHYSIQETPGLHLEGAQSAIMRHITTQLRKWLQTEQDLDRSTPLALLKDPRVDVCLYFIAPDALKPQDISFMQELSGLVPVVPILSKADSMTDAEREAFRQQVTIQLTAASVECGHPVMHQFAEAELQAAGAEANVPPFAVIGSTTADYTVGRSWPVREYAWGRVPVLASATSDVLKLKELLLAQAVGSFKHATESTYHKFRHEQLDPRPTRHHTVQQTEAFGNPRVVRGDASARPKGRNRVIKWGKAAVFGVVLLQTIGCMLLWSRSTRLQSALDAQTKDSRLQEQVLHTLQMQQQTSCQKMSSGHSTYIVDGLSYTFTHAQKYAQDASAGMNAFWQRYKHAQQQEVRFIKSAFNYTKGEAHEALKGFGTASKKAAGSVSQAVTQAVHSMHLGARHAAHSPVWKQMGIKTARVHVSAVKGIRKFAKAMQGGAHHQSHRLAKQSHHLMEHFAERMHKAQKAAAQSLFGQRFADKVHKARKASNRFFKKAVKGQLKAASKLRKWARSTSEKLSNKLLTQARFTRFAQRAAGVYGGWLGARFH